MKKRVFGLLCALLLMLSGCGVEQPEYQDVSVPTYHSGPLIPTSAPEQSVEEETEPSKVTAPPPCLEPITKLSALKWRSYPEFLSLGQGDVLACRNYFEEGIGIVNYLDVFNVYDDAVLCQSRNDMPLELVNQQFEDGQFLLRDQQSMTFYVYDRQLQLLDQFKAPDLDGYFSRDLENYYFVRSNVLYRMDVASGNYGRMVLEEELRFESLESIHPDRNILVARFYLSFYDENCGLCAIDCDTGKFLILKDDVSCLWFDGGTFYAALMDDKLPAMNICYGDLKDSHLTKVAAQSSTTVPGTYSMLPNSGIMLWHTVEEADEQATVIYDLSRNGISSKLDQYGYQLPTLNAIYLEQEQLILGLYPEEYDFAPVIIDPKVLRYEKSLSLYKEGWPSLVDRNLINQYLSQVEGPELPESLSDQRWQAEDLERTYGIKILMGEQTLGLCGTVASVETDPQRITKALNTMEQALARYPQGFLGQFRNDIREGGLYFCLTGGIQGNLNTLGKARRNGSRYEILLDITAEGLEQTVYHELWHTTEMKLSTDLFATPQWSAINPQGFAYYGHYDSGYQSLTQWTFAADGQNCYFVDPYSRINSREDRARIMETAMSGDPSDMLQSVALREKLNIMSKAIRDHFDTTGWQTPLWEQ